MDCIAGWCVSKLGLVVLVRYSQPTCGGPTCSQASICSYPETLMYSLSSVGTRLRAWIPSYITVRARGFSCTTSLGSGLSCSSSSSTLVGQRLADKKMRTQFDSLQRAFRERVRTQRVRSSGTVAEASSQEAQKAAPVSPPSGIRHADLGRAQRTAPA